MNLVRAYELVFEEVQGKVVDIETEMEREAYNEIALVDLAKELSQLKAAWRKISDFLYDNRGIGLLDKQEV